MTDLHRIRVHQTGFPGGPGVSTFYALDVATFLPSLKTLWDTLVNYQDNNVRAQVDNVGDIINDANGEITGAWAGDAQSVCTGSRSQPVAPASGYQVRWNTNTILDGHRLRGRTFVVPMATDQYTDQGLLVAGAQAAIYAAALEFQIEQSSSFVIWHRPFPGRAATATKPAKPAHDGGHGLVTTVAVPARTVVLRSRRA
jgi:hypothetical protein